MGTIERWHHYGELVNLQQAGEQCGRMGGNVGGYGGTVEAECSQKPRGTVGS